MSLEVKAVTKDFGATLKALRTARGWSQKELAKRINRSANTIWRYENNLQEPTLDTLRSFSAILGVPLSFWESEIDDSLTDSQRDAGIHLHPNRFALCFLHGGVLFLGILRFGRCGLVEIFVQVHLQCFLLSLDFYGHPRHSVFGRLNLAAQVGGDVA